MSGPQTPNHLTKTSIKRFSTFLKFLAKHDLIDKAEEHLRSKGMHDIWISLEPIKEIQQMIKAQSVGTELTPEAQAIVASIHAQEYP